MISRGEYMARLRRALLDGNVPVVIKLASQIARLFPHLDKGQLEAIFNSKSCTMVASPPVVCANVVYVWELQPPNVWEEPGVVLRWVETAYVDHILKTVQFAQEATSYAQTHWDLTKGGHSDFKMLEATSSLAHFREMQG